MVWYFRLISDSSVEERMGLVHSHIIHTMLELIGENSNADHKWELIRMKWMKERYSDRTVEEGEIDNREGIQPMHLIEESDMVMDQLDPDGISRERYGSTIVIDCRGGTRLMGSGKVDSLCAYSPCSPPFTTISSCPFPLPSSPLLFLPSGQILLPSVTIRMSERKKGKGKL